MKAPGEGGGGITPTHSAYSEVKSSFMWRLHGILGLLSCDRSVLPFLFL